MLDIFLPYLILFSVASVLSKIFFSVASSIVQYVFISLLDIFQPYLTLLDIIFSRVKYCTIFFYHIWRCSIFFSVPSSFAQYILFISLLDISLIYFTLLDIFLRRVKFCTIFFISFLDIFFTIFDVVRYFFPSLQVLHNIFYKFAR